MPPRPSQRLRVEALEARETPATFYVSPTGSNGNAGSPSAPWLTLQHAANKVAAGDTVVVRAGTYQGFNLTADGTPGARITFSAEPGVTVNAPNTFTNKDGINLEGASHVTVEGFTVVNQPRAGIRSVLNEFVVIRNNTADNNGVWGVLTGFSSDVLIENNVTTRSQAEHGIYVGNSADRPTVRGNVAWGNSKNGLHVNGDVLSQPGDGVISNALIENNVFYDNGTLGGSGVNCDGVQNSVIRNNLVYNTHASGISLYRIDGGGPSSGNQVVNNTVLVSAAGRWALNVQNGSVNNTVRNNVFFSAQSFRGAIDISADSLPGFTSDFNALENRFTTTGGSTSLDFAGWKAATGQDANSFTIADPAPLFVNAAGGDFHLKAGSAATDKGTTQFAPPTDAEGTARPWGAKVDIGRDEFSVPALAGVAVNGGAAQRSMVRTLTLTFSEAVTFAGTPAAAFTLTRTGPGAPTAVTPTVVAAGNVVTLTFPGPAGGSLADGTYTLSVNADQIRNAGGQFVAGAASTFHRLYGDADGDRDVDSDDFLEFLAVYDAPSDVFDNDGSGFVDSNDFLEFLARYDTTI